jgi:hypothetical protein
VAVDVETPSATITFGSTETLIVLPNPVSADALSPVPGWEVWAGAFAWPAGAVVVGPEVVVDVAGTVVVGATVVVLASGVVVVLGSGAVVVLVSGTVVVVVASGAVVVVLLLLFGPAMAEGPPRSIAVPSTPVENAAAVPLVTPLDAIVEKFPLPQSPSGAR